MRRNPLVRYAYALTIAIATTYSGATLDVRAASPASTVMPDGTVRFEFGRRPAPVLVCKPHYVCDITLDSGENVLNMAIGDATRWIIAGGQSGPSGTTPHVFVKPTQAQLDTNLVITTTKRVYDVTLRSANESKASRISFLYVDEDAVSRAAIAQQAVATLLAGQPLINPDQADAKYHVSGETALTPDKIFNDGVRTYIVWKALPAELPDVLAVNKEGLSQPLNFRVVGTRYIIDSVVPNFDLLVAAGTERHGRPERRASVRHL